MIKRKAYLFRLIPTAEQVVAFSRSAGCCRYVWNKALELQKKNLEEKDYTISYGSICRKLTEWKLDAEMCFLKEEVHSQSLQQTLKDLDRALKDSANGGKGFPKFKRKGKRDSFRYPQCVQIEGDRIKLPKIGWVKFIKSQEIEGKIKNVTVSRELDKWKVAIQVEIDVPEPVHPSNKAIGIDMGISRFATMSDGTVIEPIHAFRKWKRKLAIEQRSLTRKQKLSKNWQKQKLKVQRIYLNIARTRNDFLHKATSKISKSHAIVVLEDLKVKNMSASAKGTAENPGNNVKAKAGLNRSILDQGWYEFRRQLEYKQEWAGGKLILVKPANTSLQCSVCRHIAKENRISQSSFKCIACGHNEHADLNAAKNILSAGHVDLACGDIEQIAA